MEAVNVVEHAHVERRRRRAFFLVAAHVQVLVIRPPIRQPMNQPRVAVEGEDDRLVLREQRIEVSIRQAVRMLFRRLQFHQVHHVDDADFQFRQMLAKQLHGGQSLQSRHVAAAGHHHVRLAALVVAGPFPDAQALGAVLDRLVHGQPLRRGLLAGDNDVDVVPAAQAVVGHAQQGVGVRRQVDADDIGLLVDNVVDEAGSWCEKPLWSCRQTCELRK